MPRLLLILFGLLSAAHAAESTDAFERARRRSGLWFGGGAARAHLALDSASAKLNTQVDALPTIGLGGEWWSSETTGLYGRLVIGLGADLDVPALGAARISYNTHQVELGARYRWFFGPHSDALALLVGLGLRGDVQTAQVQRPSLLVDSLTLGPNVHVGVEWPIVGRRLWLRALLRAGVPFFVREAPDDSGNPVRFVALGGRVLLAAGLTERWALQLSVDAQDQRITFEGEGTRAASLFDAETHDTIFTGLLGVRYAL